MRLGEEEEEEEEERLREGGDRRVWVCEPYVDGVRGDGVSGT